MDEETGGRLRYFGELVDVCCGWRGEEVYNDGPLGSPL